jgi:hypothetical protein
MAMKIPAGHELLTAIVPDGLKPKLKARAALERKTLNQFVTETLEASVQGIAVGCPHIWVTSSNPSGDRCALCGCFGEMPGERKKEA